MRTRNEDTHDCQRCRTHCHAASGCGMTVTNRLDWKGMFVICRIIHTSNRFADEPKNVGWNPTLFIVTMSRLKATPWQPGRNVTPQRLGFQLVTAYCDIVTTHSGIHLWFVVFRFTTFGFHRFLPPFPRICKSAETLGGISKLLPLSINQTFRIAKSHFS